MQNDSKEKDLIIGRNPVLEALKAGKPIDSILISSGSSGGALGRIVAEARRAGATLKETDKKKLDRLSGGAPHQGVIAISAAKRYSTTDEIFNLAESKNEPPFIIVLDGVEDPRNLGAIIRIADCLGAHGIIIPKRRSVGLTYSVGRASAGAVEHVTVSRVSNLSSEIDELKRRGLWIYGADASEDVEKKLDREDFTGPLALVIGSEGAGISRLVKEKCDVIVSIPLRGKVNSLNASVAAGIIAYEVLRQRTSSSFP